MLTLVQVSSHRTITFMSPNKMRSFVNWQQKLRIWTYDLHRKLIYFFFFLCGSYSPRGLGPIMDFYNLYAKPEAPVPLLFPELLDAF